MDPTTGSRRKARETHKVYYRVSSSPSRDDPINSLQPSPSRILKRQSAGKKSLAQSSPEGFQAQDLSDSDDIPFICLPTASPWKAEAITYIISRRESETSVCSLPSDVPLFPHLEGKRPKSREHLNSSSWSLPSDIPIFPYVRKRAFNAGIFATPNPSLPPSVPASPSLVRPYLRYSGTGAFHKEQDPGQDLAEPAQDKNQAPGPVSFSLEVQEQNLSDPIRISQDSPSTTATPLGSPSININRKGSMAPGVSQTLDSFEMSRLIRECSIETGIGAKTAQAMLIMTFLKVSLFGIGGVMM
jgi:hypothetical protein